MQIYIVKSGDSVDGIAGRAGVSAASVIYNNQLVYPYRLAVGQSLLLSVPGEEGEKRILPVNGYAYPFISRWVLDQTLPYLTELCVFSYGFTAEGNLIPPILDDTPLIRAAKDRGVLPILTLTPLDTTGRFNNMLISAIVRDSEAKQRLIWQLGQTVTEKGYRGVDIDFEYVLPEDRLYFARFVADVRTIMNRFGYQVSVAVAPKISDDQKGVLYEGQDYGLLGEAADYVLLMTYEYGYKYGPPMAVAPLNQVRDVVEYAVSRIPREKIRLGIPNYGYDWPLPYEQGVTGARTIGNVEAVQIAIRYGSEIHFDETAQSPYFIYWQYGVRHEVWFEDVRSMQAKFDLVKEFGLGGIGYWSIMQLFRANWLLLADQFWIKKTDSQNPESRIE